MKYRIIDLQGSDFLAYDLNENQRYFKNKSEIRNTLLSIGKIDGTFNKTETDIRHLTLNDLLEIWMLETEEVN